LYRNYSIRTIRHRGYYLLSITDDRGHYSKSGIND